MKALEEKKPIRDFILLILLLALIKPALRMSAKRMQKQRQSDDSFLIYEPAQEVIQAFESAYKQLDQAMCSAQKKGEKEAVAQLNDLSENLTYAENYYTSNSPGLFLLGPFATVYALLKESEIKCLIASSVSEIEKIQNQLYHEKKSKSL